MILFRFGFGKKNNNIYRLLRQYENDQNKFVYFNFPLIDDCLSSCNCVITSRNIEIMPKGIYISNISGFENAMRRIFMSATLADDITPEKANDIGDRLILFPTHLNKLITDEEIKRKVIELSTDYNIVIIVPSYERGKFWDETGNRIINKENIDSAVANLKKSILDCLFLSIVMMELIYLMMLVESLLLMDCHR